MRKSRRLKLSVETRLKALEKKVGDLGEYEFDIPWLKNRVEQLEYRVIYYRTKVETIRAIRSRERMVADPGPNFFLGCDPSIKPVRRARQELVKLLQYAHKRGWVEGREKKP